MTSRAAPSPFSAKSAPPGTTSGQQIVRSFSRLATALAVTYLYCVKCSCARPRTTVTRPPTPNSWTNSVRSVIRRNKGSSRVILKSGRARAMTSPGRPAPLPTSSTSDPGSNSGATLKQLSRCRSQIRAASRGPIAPRSTPTVAKRLA